MCFEKILINIDKNINYENHQKRHLDKLNVLPTKR